MKNIQYVFLIFAVFFASCKNQDWEFPDFDYQTVYFAHQYPVRTITLGEDLYDTSLDNEWKFQIMATTGGVYESGTVGIDIEVDNSLVNGLLFSNGGSNVVAMPSTYYTLASNQIVIPKGKLVGGVEVQLTEAFFADPLAIHNTYVIPVLMTGVTNADSILSGTPITDNPNRVDPSHWNIAPKDYVLYAVKYINPWHGFYLRRGSDEVIKNGVASSELRHKEFVEDDEVVKLTTTSLTGLIFPLSYKSKDGHDLGVKVALSLDEDNKFTVAPEALSYQVNDTIRVFNVEASGTGVFVEKGEKKSWGNQDRDAMYLQYQVKYEVEVKYPTEGLPDDIEQVSYSTTDTLVMRNRGVAMELFTPVKQ